MDAKQINQTFDLIGYVSGIVKLHKSGAYWIGPCPICEDHGRDRFQIKQADGDMWICRKSRAGQVSQRDRFLHGIPPARLQTGLRAHGWKFTSTKMRA